MKKLQLNVICLMFNWILKWMQLNRMKQDIGTTHWKEIWWTRNVCFTNLMKHTRRAFVVSLELWYWRFSRSWLGSLQTKQKNVLLVLSMNYYPILFSSFFFLLFCFAVAYGNERLLWIDSLWLLSLRVVPTTKSKRKEVTISPCYSI